MPYELKPKRMSTSSERVFRPVRVDGYSGTQLFREFTLMFIHVHDSDTNAVVSTKLDRTIPGKWYKVAGLNERSSNGEQTISYVPPDDPAQNPVRLRLVALATDVNGNVVFR